MTEVASTAGIPQRLQLGSRVLSGVMVVDVVGEVDIYTCEQLRDHLLVAAGEVTAGAADRSLIVNLADLTFIDSTGLGVLVGVWHRMQASEGVLALAAPSRTARTALDTTGLSKALPVYDTEEQAVQASRPRDAGPPVPAG